MEGFTERKCHHCGERVVGRIDKKFCSDACRNSFNNDRNKDQTNLMRNINNQLRKNHRILLTYATSNHLKKIDRNELITQGFSFTYHTHVYTPLTGLTYFFVYDIGYAVIEEDFLKIKIK